MCRLMIWMLVIVLACGGVAHADRAKKALDNWDAVTALRPGTEISVLPGNQAGPDRCLMSSADDTSLTCLAENSAADVRLIFPRNAVREVRVYELDHGWGPLTWVKAVLVGGGLTLAGLCIAANPLCVLPVGVVALVIAEGPQSGPYPMPMRPPARPRLRWRLVYRGATP
jgi:hypothetical protein